MTKVVAQGGNVVELSLEDLTAPNLIQGLVVWTALCGRREAPAWVDVDLVAFPSQLLPKATVVDVVDDAEDFVYRYWGSGLSEVYGADETGRKTSELASVEFRDRRRREMRAVVDGCRPKLFLTELEKSNGVRAQKIILRLPVMDQPGQVTKVISLAEFGPVDYRPSGPLT